MARKKIALIGAGMIGVLTVQAAKNAGCTTVYAVDLDDSKLAMAVKLGAAEGFNPKNCDPAAEILKRTGGKGADIVLEAVGATEPIKTALACFEVRNNVHLETVSPETPTDPDPIK